MVVFFFFEARRGIRQIMTEENRIFYTKTSKHYIFFLGTFTSQLLDKPWSQVSSLLPSRFLPSIFIAHRVQQSHCSSIFHRVLLAHALAISASHFVRKKQSKQILTSMHSAGLVLTKLTYTRLEDNLIRHRGDRQYMCRARPIRAHTFKIGG